MSAADPDASIRVVAFGVVIQPPDAGPDGCALLLSIPSGEAGDRAPVLEQRVHAAPGPLAEQARCYRPGDRVFVRGTLSVWDRKPSEEDPEPGALFQIDAEGLALELDTPAAQPGRSRPDGRPRSAETRGQAGQMRLPESPAQNSAAAKASSPQGVPAPDPGTISAAQSEQLETARQLIALASDMAAAGQLTQAAQTFRQALASCPAGPHTAGVRVRALRGLGAVHGNAGDAEGAARAFQQALALLDPDAARTREELHAELARVLAQLGDREAAQLACERWLSSARARPDGTRSAVRALERLTGLAAAAGKTRQAAEACQEWIRLLTTLPGSEDERLRALLRLAALYRELGRPDAAENVARATIELAPACADPSRGLAEGHQLLAGTLSGQERFAEAAEEYERAAALLRDQPGQEPELAQACLLEGLARKHSGDFAGAITALTAAVELLRRLPGREEQEWLSEALYELGVLLIRRERSGEARAALLECFELLRAQGGSSQQLDRVQRALTAAEGETPPDFF